ncbi:FAD-dependent oxidoreductase [uncultured Hoeflea sp.]|uniref:NAD(P)/FAD-dependent oxidoreductase n=1 Tax=uncultured Hoeflea sp. TaxID=538666 RepID=UPI0030DBE984|tara:strand:+ start:401 stop:1714 length:1314 start_codon:yes stop_codon:yes gene_type:complete
MLLEPDHLCSDTGNNLTPMTSSVNKVVIVGAGQAGLHAAALLRSGGYQGEILLIGAEPASPYQRPPLSKAFLKGEINFESLRLKSQTFLADQKIDFRPGITVERIDRDRKTVWLGDGSREGYDILIIATGSRPRPIAGIEDGVGGLHYLRTLEDSQRLRDALRPPARIALIGGGYLGLEVAAAAVEMGADAVVFEREKRLLSRVASAPVSDFLRAYHHGRGVAIVTEAQIGGLEVADGRVAAIRLEDGRRFPCTAVLVCVGGIPNDELARHAGLRCDGGIIVDAGGRTNDPSIFAIGDVSRRPLPFNDNRTHRLESVANAMGQARSAVAAILDQAKPEDEVPWFWSDQFEMKFKSAGLAIDADRQILRGASGHRGFSVLHLKDERLICIETINNTGDFMAGKKLIASRLRLDADEICDPAIPLKNLLPVAHVRTSRP